MTAVGIEAARLRPTRRRVGKDAARRAHRLRVIAKVVGKSNTICPPYAPSTTLRVVPLPPLRGGGTGPRIKSGNDGGELESGAGATDAP